MVITSKSRRSMGAIVYPTTLNMDSTERIEAASKFLLQSPPGEINDVLNGALHESFTAVVAATHMSNGTPSRLGADVRNIISDDDSLQAGVLPALREYNLSQFITAEVPGHQHQVSNLLYLHLGSTGLSIFSDDRERSRTLTTSSRCRRGRTCSG